MSSSNNQGLNERLAHKKRVQRIKTGIILFVITWMLVSMLISVTLIVKVFSLQKQIDILTENTIKSQQVEQQENEAAGPGELEKYDSAGQGSVADDASEKALQTEGKASDAADAAVKTEDMKVYLTFDDGPSANTERILDILDSYNIKATFFVVGKEDEKSLERYQQIVERGHTLGMHSYSHKYNLVYESLDSFKEDLNKIQSLLKETTGEECRLYRFPGGSSNQVSNTDMSEFIRYLNEAGITYYDWNVECGDATDHAYTADEMVENVMNDVVKHSTSVVLMHDAEDKPNTVEALPLIIEKLQGLGAQILPIDENAAVIQHVSADSVEE